MQLDKVQNLGNFVGVVNVPRFAFPPATLCQVLISAYICPSVWGWGEDPPLLRSLLQTRTARCFRDHRMFRSRSTPLRVHPSSTLDKNRP